MSAKTGTGGPPNGARNALKNGTRMRKERLVIGELPKKLNSVKREARAYRRAMESEVIQIRGDISVSDAHLIDTACAATSHAGIMRWLLREKIEQMTTADIVAVSREILKAKQARDAAVRQLELDVQPDEWDGIYEIEAKDATE